jgi:predicted extracellular nuclease
MKRVSILACLSISLLATAACRGGGSGDDDDDTPDGPPTNKTRIQDVQNDSMPKGTPVALEGVIVTAIDAFGARTGDLWVQDPAGGEFSGIKVFGAPLDQVAQLAPGDIVNITNAEKDEFALTSDMSGRTVTEIKGAAGGMMSITKTGSGAVPTPATVDAKTIEELPDEAARDAEWEKWEGVLINVTNVRQLSEYGPFSSTSMAEDQQEFEATGGIAVQSVLANLGTPAERVAGTCYASITGIGDYFFNYLLLPRGASDLVGGGNGCGVVKAVTITDIQSGTATGSVNLKDVFVVARSFNNKNLWVSQNLNAAPNEGIFVFRGNGAANLDAAIAPGAKVDVSGTVTENNNDMMGDTVTQLSGGSVTLVTAAAGAPVPVTNQTAADLLVAATGEPFESVLVTLTNVKIVAIPDPANFGMGMMQQGAATFLTDDDTLRLPDPVNTCFASVTGIWTYQVFENTYAFLPISGTGTGTCN